MDISDETQFPGLHPAQEILSHAYYDTIKLNLEEIQLVGPVNSDNPQRLPTVFVGNGTSRSALTVNGLGDSSWSNIVLEFLRESLTNGHIQHSFRKKLLEKIVPDAQAHFAELAKKFQGEAEAKLFPAVEALLNTARTSKDGAVESLFSELLNSPDSASVENSSLVRDFKKAVIDFCQSIEKVFRNASSNTVKEAIDEVRLIELVLGESIESRKLLVEKLEEKLRVPDNINFKSSPFHHVLASLCKNNVVRHIVTTNYDTFLEDSLIGDSNLPAVQILVRNASSGLEPPGRIQIHKMHGSLSGGQKQKANACKIHFPAKMSWIDSIVISSSDYHACVNEVYRIDDARDSGDSGFADAMTSPIIVIGKGFYSNDPSPQLAMQRSSWQKARLFDGFREVSSSSADTVRIAGYVVCTSEPTADQLLNMSLCKMLALVVDKKKLFSKCSELLEPNHELSTNDFHSWAYAVSLALLAGGKNAKEIIKTTLKHWSKFVTVSTASTISPGAGENVSQNVAANPASVEGLGALLKLFAMSAVTFKPGGEQSNAGILEVLKALMAPSANGRTTRAAAIVDGLMSQNVSPPANVSNGASESEAEPSPSAFIETLDNYFCKPNISLSWPFLRSLLLPQTDRSHLAAGGTYSNMTAEESQGEELD